MLLLLRVLEKNEKTEHLWHVLSVKPQVFKVNPEVTTVEEFLASSRLSVADRMYFHRMAGMRNRSSENSPNFFMWMPVSKD